jgi:hypothetical protein
MKAFSAAQNFLAVGTAFHLNWAAFATGQDYGCQRN